MMHSALNSWAKFAMSAPYDAAMLVLLFAMAIGAVIFAIVECRKSTAKHRREKARAKARAKKRAR